MTSAVDLRVGLLGIGTVGSGTFAVLKRNQDLIKNRTGKTIAITMVADLDEKRAREVVGQDVQVVNDANLVINDPNVDVVIELIGGYTKAKEFVLAAINQGKHVVTANKALLAVHGAEIFAAAKAKGVIVAYEASVAGGIPIIKVVREGLAGNQIEVIAGIINGTTNYILSEMAQKGADFAPSLADAQKLGYAELDPTFDIEGIDAAHKITLLASIAFGIPVDFNKTYVEGITKITAQDIKFAKELGYTIKLLGITRQDERGIELRVHPTLIPQTILLANVMGAMNAVLVQGDAVGTTMFYGKGAGSEPTASAVVADLTDLARQIGTNATPPALGFNTLTPQTILPMDEVVTSHYLRMQVLDEKGVLKAITAILAEHDISIDAMLQKEATDGATETSLVILTHPVMEKTMKQALTKIKEQSFIHGDIARIRMEHLG